MSKKPGKEEVGLLVVGPQLASFSGALGSIDRNTEATAKMLEDMQLQADFVARHLDTLRQLIKATVLAQRQNAERGGGITDALSQALIDHYGSGGPGGGR